MWRDSSPSQSHTDQESSSEEALVGISGQEEVRRFGAGCPGNRGRALGSAGSALAG